MNHSAQIKHKFNQLLAEKTMKAIAEEAKQLEKSERSQIAELFLERGKHLLQFENKSKETMRMLKSALKLDPKLAEAHLLIGSLLVDGIGSPQEIARFQEAADHFAKGSELKASCGGSLESEQLWKWGICDFYFAKHSEEPLDYKNSVDKLREVYNRGFRATPFLIDYGASLGELGILTGRHELLLEAVSVIHEGLEINERYPGGWTRLALLYKFLYEKSGDPAYFEKSDQSFVSAARLFSENPSLWVSWGDLLLKEGMYLRDSQMIASALDKFDHASQLDNSWSIPKARMADALLGLGELEEDYELMKEAHQILEEIRPTSEQIPEFYALLGSCYYQMGRYFSDASYFEKAIASIEKGLELTKSHASLWHLLANVYFAKGELDADLQSFEKAAKFSSQANRLHNGVNPNWLNDYGVALMKVGELTSDPQPLLLAVSKFQEAISFASKTFEDAVDPEWFYNMGAAFDYLGECTGEVKHYEHAIGILGRLLEQYPTHQHVRYNLALALFHLGDTIGELEPLERAEELFEEILNAKGFQDKDYIFEDYGLCLIVLGDLLVQSGEGFLRSKAAFERAESILLEAVRLGSRLANYHLSCLYALTERFEEAVYFLRRARTHQALPELEHLLQESWFDSMKENSEFKVFIATLTEEG